jgi:hypothetical protein
MKSLSNRSLRRIARVIGEKEPEGETSLKDEVIDFFSENSDPEDELLHEWAESKGYEPDEVETEVYKLATAYVKFLTGGRFNETNIREDEVDSDELALGIEVELEHTPDEETAKRIALDHLAELPDYYTRLRKMEED